MAEAYFINHCEPPCGLGEFQYECPVCKEVGIDYEVWFEEDKIYDGKICEFTCEFCKAKLFVKWNKDKNFFEVYV
jgi:hypothetical protein